MLLSDNEENRLLSMKKDVLYSNHLAEKEAIRIRIFLRVKSVGYRATKEPGSKVTMPFKLSYITRNK